MSDNAVIVLVALVGAVQVMTVALINAHYRALDGRGRSVSPAGGSAGPDIDVDRPGASGPDADSPASGGLLDGGPAGGDVGGVAEQVA